MLCRCAYSKLVLPGCAPRCPARNPWCGSGHIHRCFCLLAHHVGIHGAEPDITTSQNARPCTTRKIHGAEPDTFATGFVRICTMREFVVRMQTHQTLGMSGLAPPADSWCVTRHNHQPKRPPLHHPQIHGAEPDITTSQNVRSRTIKPFNAQQAPLVLPRPQIQNSQIHLCILVHVSSFILNNLSTSTYAHPACQTQNPVRILCDWVRNKCAIRFL